MKKSMFILAATVLLAGFSPVLASAGEAVMEETKIVEEELTLTQEWDKAFPLSEEVNHRKVTFPLKTKQRRNNYSRLISYSSLNFPL